MKLMLIIVLNYINATLTPVTCSKIWLTSRKKGDKIDETFKNTFQNSPLYSPQIFTQVTSDEIYFIE